MTTVGQGSCLAYPDIEEGEGRVQTGDPGHLAQPQLLHPLGQEAQQVRPQAVPHQLNALQHGAAVGLNQEENWNKTLLYAPNCLLRHTYL